MVIISNTNPLIGFVIIIIINWNCLYIVIYTDEDLCNYQIQIDEKLAKEKAIDDWLTVTSSRNAKWWYSAFHNVTAMVGAGVLSLPYAMSELGWYVFTF